MVMNEFVKQGLHYLNVGSNFAQTHWVLSIYMAILVIAVYLFACADADDEGLNGAASRTLLQKIPTVVRSVVKKIFGKRIYGCCAGTIDYVAHQRNPILQIGYLAILNGAFLGWLWWGVPQLPTFLASEIHIAGGYIGVVVCQVAFYFACTVGPGHLTKENVHCFSHAPHDGLLFAADMQCKTCKVPKVCQRAAD